MSTTFGQAYRQETEEVQSGSIAPPAADVSRKSVAKASAQGTVDSNFQSIGQVEVERVDQDAHKIMSALLSVAGTAADVIGKEQRRKKVVEGARLAGTADGREAIDGMDTVVSKIFGPSITQRAGQEQIVKDTTIALNGKLTNDAGTIGLKMSDAEWDAHVDKTMSAQTDLYKDEDIKDMITGDFAKRLGTIQSGWIKKSTVYRQQVAKESFEKTVHNTFDQVSPNLQSIDPQVKADAQQAVRDIVQRPAGMTEEAHRTSLVESLSRQLTIGNKDVYDAFKNTGAFAELNQSQQDELESMESAYNAKNDAGWLAGVDALEKMGNATNRDGSARFSVQEQLDAAYALRDQNPEAWAIAGLESTVNNMMTTMNKFQEQQITDNENFTLIAGGSSLAVFRTQKPADAQRALTANITTKLSDSIIAENAAEAAARGEAPDPNFQPTEREMLIQLASKPQAISELWSSVNEPSDYIEKFGMDVYNKIMHVQPDDAEDKALLTQIRALETLNQTNPTLFLKQFKENGPEMLSIFKSIEQNGNSPWAAVARLKDDRISMALKADTGDLDPEQLVQMNKRLGKSFEDLVDDLPNQGGWWTDATPENADEIKNAMMQIALVEYGRGHDSTDAMDLAKAQVLQQGAQVGPVFIVGGAKAEEISGFNIEKYVRGFSDDDEINGLMVEKYGLPKDTNFLDQMKRATISPDGRTIIGWLETETMGQKPFAFDMPTSQEMMLPSAEEQRRTMLANVLRLGRDAVIEVRGGGINPKAPSPIKDGIVATGDAVVQVNTGSNPSHDRPAQIAHVRAQEAYKKKEAERQRKANTYVGSAAIKQVESMEGRPLTYIEKTIVGYEGFVDGEYPDKKGMASGVGQTGEYRDMSFDETVKAHVVRIKNPKKLPDYDSYPEYLRAELLAAEYRGDIGESPKAMAYARAGEWEKAAIEFLNNDEYKHINTPAGIKQRMRNTAMAMTKYGQSL